MKKYITTIIVTVGVLAGVSALAATSINLSPATVNVKAGQTFMVTVSVNPQDVKNYTVKLKLNFPADLLQIQSFAFAGQWMPLSQSGYELTDNTNGVLIKTAGYPQGFSTNTQFGTVTFKAQKTGTGVIALADGTMALDQSNQNLFAGSSQVNVSVTASGASVTPTPRSNTQSNTQLNNQTPTPETATIALVTPTPSTQPPIQQASILGAIGNGLELGTGSWLVAVIVFLVIICVAYWLIRKILKK